jgi:DnaK suppressor protein
MQTSVARGTSAALIVVSNSLACKGTTTVKTTELARYRKILAAQREEILRHAHRAHEGELDANRDDSPDELDTASSESVLSFAGQIREREERLLHKIDHSLEKIELGTYGECEECGEAIGVARLKARPIANLCIDCKVDQERLED